MPRLLLAATSLIVLTLSADPAHAREDRRKRTTPGLVLQTPGRHAACDVLTFTPDGTELLAAGDDKVIRVWPVAKDQLQTDAARVLRWPIFREQLGSIYAFALSPHDGGKSVAVGGHGVFTGLVFVLNRTTGDVEHVMDEKLSTQVTTAIAWSPDGKYVVFGNADGELFRWEPRSGEKSATRFTGTQSKGQSNRVRCVAFVDGRHVVSVTADGWVWRRDVTAPGSQPEKAFLRLSRGDVFVAAVSPDSRWLAACNRNVVGQTAETTMAVELIDLRNPTNRQSLTLPSVRDVAHYPIALAFDSTSRKLAVGTQEVANLLNGEETFARITGGVVHAWTLGASGWTRETRAGLQIGYAVDALAWRPGHATQLAVAGGPNHEVRLFDVSKEGKALSTIRSPGSCLWSVAVSRDDKYLAWKEQLNPRPRHPNDRATGPWRVFTLDDKVRRILAEEPKDFTPVAPLRTYGGWRVKPSVSGFVWDVEGPGGIKATLNEESGLYLARVNQVPRCYTFLPPMDGKPLRLAIGHQWGVSLYELGEKGVRFVRLMVGHDGEVMSLAASPKGTLLFTCGRDQTIACWSLVDWPEQAELGASFGEQGGAILVRKVDLGSPAWEAGLTDGDEIVLLASIDPDGRSGFVYDPENQGLERHQLRMPRPRLVGREQAVKLLARAEPARQYIFVKRHKDAAGKVEEQKHLTTVRQRPLWRFFPTRVEEGNHWIVWRWRDFFYDTTAPDADRLIGWQVNPEVWTRKPEFYQLSAYSGSGMRGAKNEPLGFHNPGKVWRFIKSTNQEPQKVLFPDIEPPEVSLTVETQPDVVKKQALVLRVVARPRNNGPQQALSRVTLWLDDYQYAVLPIVGGNVNTQVTIPLERLRRGRNEVTLSCFNAEGGRAEALATVTFVDATRPKATLHALCVGVNNYRRVKASFDDEESIDDLQCSKTDALALAEVFKQHNQSKLFEKADVRTLVEEQVTSKAILDRLRALTKPKAVSPDDWLVLFLSGHGYSPRPEDAYEIRKFYYVCADSDAARTQTMLDAAELRKVLQDIPCRKLILLDACHSGALVSSPLRELNREGPRFLIFAACNPDEKALEPNLKLTRDIPRLRDLQHGVFTEGLLVALGRPDRFDARRGRQSAVSAQQIADDVKLTVDTLMLRLELKPEKHQRPVFEPSRNDPRLRLELFCRP